MNSDFPIHQFRLAITTTEKIKSSLHPFFLEYRRRNPKWIIGSLEEIYKCLQGKETSLQRTFNSIFATKYIVDTGDNLMISLVETYLLPMIYQIACFDLREYGGRRGSRYFLNKGFEAQRSQQQFFGFNYIRMACELIIIAAVIKPHRTNRGEEIDFPSDFSIALAKLQEKGFNNYQSYVFYRQNNIKQSRKDFLTNLNTFGQHKTDFDKYYLSLIRQYLIREKNQDCLINIDRMLEKGEMPLCNWALEECFISLKSIDLNERRRALKIMSDFVQWGDISVAYAINCQGVINNLITELIDPRVSSTTIAQIFFSSSNTKQQKQTYYYFLLKTIRFWSLCYPKALKDHSKMSNIKHIYQQLKTTRGLQFPEQQDLNALQAIHHSNAAKKMKINTIILSKLPKDDTYLIFPQLINEVGPASQKTAFEQFRQDIIAIRDILNSIYHQDQKIKEFIPVLRNFQAEFDLKIQNGHFNNNQLQYIVSQGAPLLERIQKIMPSLQDYERQKIGLKELKNILLSKNKQITTSKTYYQPYILENEAPSSASKGEQLSSIKNSLEKELKQLKEVKPSRFKPNPQNIKKEMPLEKPILKYTQSYDFALNLMPCDKSKVSNLTKKQRKPSLSDGGLTDVNYQDLLESRPEKQRNHDQLLKIVKPFQSLQDYKEEYGVTLGKNPQNSLSTLKIYNKYNPLESKISEKKEEEKSDKIGQSNPGDQMEASFGLVTFKKEKKDEINENNQEHPKEVDLDCIFTQPLPVTSRFNPLLLRPLSKQCQPPIVISQKESIIDFSVSEESQLKAPNFIPQQFSYLEVRTAEDILQKKPTSFLAFLQEDRDYLPIKKRSNSLKLLQQGTKQIIRPFHPKHHKRSISDNLNSIFQKKLAIGSDNMNLEVKMRGHDSNKQKITILKNKIGTIQPDSTLMNLRLSKGGQTEHTSKYPTTSRQQRDKNLEDDLTFKQNFLNSRLGRNSLNAYQNDLQLSNFREISNNEHQVWCSDFRQHFSKLKLQEQKKNQLRTRMLLLKNQLLEIGCTCKVENHKYFVTFYITSNQDIKSFAYHIEQDGNMIIANEEQQFSKIQLGKQKRIKLEVRPLKVPYSIPTIHFNYQQKCHYQRTSSLEEKHSYQIPCAFHKFVLLDPVKESEVLAAFEKRQEVYVTEEIKYSTKVMRIFTELSEYLPNGMFLRGGTPNYKNDVEFVGKGDINGTHFYLKISLKSNQILQIRVSSRKMTQSLKFFMATIGTLFLKK